MRPGPPFTKRFPTHWRLSGSCQNCGGCGMRCEWTSVGYNAPTLFFVMPPDHQSIEDLLKSAKTPSKSAGEETALEKFDDKMAEVRLKEKETEVERQAAALGIPYLNLKGFPISPEALILIPREQATALQAI